jgi:hypothetical protein
MERSRKHRNQAIEVEGCCLRSVAESESRNRIAGTRRRRSEAGGAMAILSLFWLHAAWAIDREIHVLKIKSVAWEPA